VEPVLRPTVPKVKRNHRRAASRLLNLADVLRENQVHYRFFPAHHEIVHGSVEATEGVFWM